MPLNGKIAVVSEFCKKFDLTKKGFTLLKTYKTFKEAINAHKKITFDVIIIDHSQITLKSIKLLQKQLPIIIIFTATSESLLEFIFPKDLFFFIIAKNSPIELVLETIDSAVNTSKKKTRLFALREHQDNQITNKKYPILNSFSKIIKELALAEDSNHILRAISHISTQLSFSKSMLITHENINSTNNELISIFYSNEKNNKLLTDVILEPWSTALVVKFSDAKLYTEKNGYIKYLVFYRKELLPFTERDKWLVEMIYGPIALALEKVDLLAHVKSASSEWRNTFDTISEPITVINENFKIIKANIAFSKLINKKVTDIKDHFCFYLLAKRNAPCQNCPRINQKYSGNKIKVQEKNDLLSWSYPVEIRKNRYYVQFYRDISKEQNLISTLIQSEKMNAIGKLVNAIAHEINNPLTAILAISQLLLKSEGKLNLEKQNFDLIVEIEQAAKRSKKIISDLFNFSQAQSTKLETVKLPELIASVLTFAKLALKNIRTHVDIADDIPIFLSSSSAIQQILFNLITNASHAMHAGGDLKIIAKKVGHNVEIKIIDTGHGISAKQLKHIFDPFHTNKEVGTGTGLGLSIVQNMVIHLNGKITVESKLKQGTTFKLEIPLRTIKKDYEKTSYTHC